MATAPDVASPANELASWVRDARDRTLRLASGLTDEQRMGPRLAIVNPLLWEIGHVAWFQELWVLRHAAGRRPLRGDGDSLYDSTAVPHDVRWDLPLPSLAETLAYLEDVRHLVLDRLKRGSLGENDLYFVRLSVFHEDMHDEAFMHSRQTLGYPAPAFGPPTPRAAAAPAAIDIGDAHVLGGTFLLGATGEEPFVFDNEKWMHPVAVAPFSMARANVTQAEFAQFVDDGGYERKELWTVDGWAWRARAAAKAPVYWRRDGRRFERRVFDRWVELEPRLPVIHVNAFEAEAWCRWARRRLPTEAEWEVAAAGEPDASGRALSSARRTHPWGDGAPGPEHANLNGRAHGPVDVASLPAGDSAFGVRQMWGNAWQWTSTAFRAYPGFAADPYREYSEPWFGTHRVLRGGCFATQARLLRNTWRNFYTPDRRDIFAGFRTCALSD